MTKYCTLARAKTEVDKTGTSQTVADNYLLNAIESVSRRIDGILQPTNRLSKRPFFAPYLESRAFIYHDNQINSPLGTVDIQQYYLELNTVTSDTTVITSSVTPFINGFPPYRELQLIATSSYSWYNVGCSSNTRLRIPPLLTVNALWGWHPDWDNAWVDTATLNGNVLATATTIAVQTGEGALFSPGHFIKVNAEYMEITSISTDTLTVKRAQNGTTAAAHTSADDVAIYDISEDIQRVTARQASAMMAKHGAFESQQFSDFGVKVVYNEDLLPELVNTIEVYQG